MNFSLENEKEFETWLAHLDGPDATFSLSHIGKTIMAASGYTTNDRLVKYACDKIIGRIMIGCRSWLEARGKGINAVPSVLGHMDPFSTSGISILQGTDNALDHFERIMRKTLRESGTGKFGEYFAMSYYHLVNGACLNCSLLDKVPVYLTAVPAKHAHDNMWVWVPFGPEIKASDLANAGVGLNKTFAPMAGFCKGCKGECKECQHQITAWDTAEILNYRKYKVCVKCIGTQLTSIDHYVPRRDTLLGMRARMHQLGGGRHGR